MADLCELSASETDAIAELLDAVRARARREAFLEAAEWLSDKSAKAARYPGGEGAKAFSAYSNASSVMRRWANQVKDE